MAEKFIKPPQVHVHVVVILDYYPGGYAHDIVCVHVSGGMLTYSSNSWVKPWSLYVADSVIHKHACTCRWWDRHLWYISRFSLIRRVLHCATVVVVVCMCTRVSEWVVEGSDCCVWQILPQALTTQALSSAARSSSGTRPLQRERSRWLIYINFNNWTKINIHDSSGLA